MAKIKLTSVFTKEDVYTVLQLLKALADGVDTNEELTDADIEQLKTSIEKLNSALSIAEDNTTTIANGIVIKPTGDVDIGKNLDVDGNIVKGYAGIYHLPDGTEDGFSQYMDVIVFEGGDVNSHMFFGLSLGEDSGLCYAPITDSAGNNITDPAQLPNGIFNLGYCSTILGDDAQRQINDLSREVSGLKNKISTYYQHTVKMEMAEKNNMGQGIYFTALSTSNVPIDSYQDLQTVFGDRDIAVTGFIVIQQTPTDYLQVPVKYLNLHGGSITTDKVCVFTLALDTSLINEYALSELDTITFKDDVCLL